MSNTRSGDTQGDTMKINRLRVSAVGAAAVLAIAGAGAGLASAADPVVSGDNTAAETGIEAEATSVETTGVEAEATTAETTGVEADGIGGHQDAPGQNVDHQFEGQE
jgi:hypothetical protein